MSGFAAEWLALREQADRDARDLDLARRFAAALPPEPTILDLGAGTGANARAMAPRIAGRGTEPRWLLVENDPALRALQPASMHDLHYESIARDLAEGLGDLSADGVTASALLDLAGADWLEHLAHWLERRGVPFLAALSVDGGRDYWPRDPEDARIAAWFAIHQRRDKGLGPALGPAASGVLAESLARRGFAVSTAASDWRLGPDRPHLLAELVRGEAAAARDAAPDEADAAAGWEQRRLAHIAEGRLGARIGHRDLLALPR